MGLCLFIKVVKLLSQNYQVHFHQVSALILLLFITVMDVLIEYVRDGLLMELLYADDLVLCKELLNEVMEKYKRWKCTVEGNCLRVNVENRRYAVNIWKEK